MDLERSVKIVEVTAKSGNPDLKRHATWGMPDAKAVNMSFRNLKAGQIGVLVIALMVALGTGAPVAAQDRHALVIGIDSYDNVSSLAKARNDARAVAGTLEDAGFNTQLLIDVSGFDLLTQLSRFSQQLNPGDQVVFYFAGHGVEIEGQNYLLPADVPQLGPGQELVIRRAALPVEEIIAQFNSRGVRLSLLILDACRDNPFETVGTRSLGGTRGLRQEVPPEGTFIMFSAGAGQAALDRLSDDDPNPNSVFTRVLLPRLSQPGLPLRTMVREIRSEVRQLGLTVGHEQFPAVYDQLDGAFLFVPDDGDEAPLADPGPQVTASTLTGPCAAARVDWSMIGETPTARILQAFRQTHADCSLMVAMADQRLAVLAETEAVARVVAPTLEPQIAPDRVSDVEATRAVTACEAVAGPDTVPWSQLEASDLNHAEITCRTALQAELGDGSDDHALVQTLLGRVLNAQERYTEALELYQSGADAGNAQAMNNLGVMYRNGSGVTQSDTEAVRWYRAGADAGNAEAMNNLGVMYRNGSGVTQSDTEAVRWHRAGADEGHALAMTSLGWMYANGRGVTQSDTEAVRWYRAGADAGNADAMTSLAWRYRNGRGVPVNNREAARWFMRGLEAGSDYAIRNPDEFDGDAGRELQRHLRDAGFYNGAIDGAVGQGTVAAMQAYFDANN